MYKVAVIGDQASVLGFSALGLVASAAENAQEAASQLHSLAKSGHGIIFITEHLAAEIRDDIARYEGSPECAIIMIPSAQGRLGIGMQEMHLAVEKAVGADILKDKE